MDTVNLSFRYSENDYVRAARAHYAARLRLPLDVAVTIVLVGIGVCEWHTGSPGFGLTLFCVAGVFALVLVAAFIVIPHYAFRRQPKFLDEYALTFSSQGIHFRTGYYVSGQASK